MAIYYHTTDRAEAILRDGFTDPEGAHLFGDRWLRGIFLSDWPVGAPGDQTLEVEIADFLDLGAYAIVEEGSVSEWCVPAAMVNARARVRLLAPHEVDEVVTRWSFVRRSRGS